MVPHATNWCQLLALSCNLASWVLVHDVGEIDPLITTAVTVLCWVGLWTWDRLVNSTHSLGVISSHKHRGFPMACARGLRSDHGSCIHVCSYVWACVAYARLLDEMNLARSCSRSLVSLLEVAKKTLHFLMTTWCGDVCKLRTIDMLHVRQLANWLVDNTLWVVWRLGHSSLTLAMLNLAWCSSVRGAPSGTGCCLLVFLEVEAGSCSILLRFWGDNSLVTTLSVWQMPLLWARPILRVLASSFHMKWIFADQLDCATLVRLLLRLISGWHDSIWVLVMNSSMIVSLLVSSNATSDWKVTLYVYLWSRSWSLWRTLGLIISAQLPATVKSARVLHDGTRRAISAVVVCFRHADDLLSWGPRGWALVRVGASDDWVGICCAQSCTICNASLIRKRPIQIISVRSSSHCTWFSTLKPFLT